MASKTGNLNSAYEHYGDNETFERSEKRNPEVNEKTIDIENGNNTGHERATWSNKTHFLMSCIQTSVGLGNIWRFPFVAYENGGGAFLIPYLVVLFVIGKPMYYLEMFVGQFTSKSPIKVWAVNPALRGIGVGSLVSGISVVTYYSSLIALTVYYFFASFAWVLPWSTCLPEWGSNCVDSQPRLLADGIAPVQNVSSSEMYFLKTVLNETLDISNGIGLPSWRLALCLFGSWLIVYIIISRGVKSSGKASYFLALFPYVIIFALLIRAVTLEGASKGIMYFLTPQWSELLNPKIWYAAVNQAFFSLGLGMSAIVTFGSYNEFHYDFYRDVMIVTSLDTVTSFIAGVTIFGILGNLAHNLGLEDIRSVVKSGTGLAFISYPDAISKFDFLPQVFAILFFFMLFTLGLGSAVGIQNNLVTIICDQFPRVKYGWMAAISSLLGFLGGLIYLTPGGQWMVVLVDTYGGTMMIFFLGIFELVGIFWMYGIEDFCLDLEFTIGRKPSFYWRICWLVLAPVSMILVFVYQMATMETVSYSGLEFPPEYVAAGWTILAIGAVQLPIWFVYAYAQSTKTTSACKAICKSFRPNEQWGPSKLQDRIEWLKFKEEAKQKRRLLAKNANHSGLTRKLYTWFGKYQ